MGTDASSLSPEDVIDALERIVRLMIAQTPIAMQCTETNLLPQVIVALDMARQWREQTMKIIPNFEEIIDEATLDALHDHYTEYDISDEE